jgi:non-ribosomal peptide synthetase component E (peptide arylation enzyme)
MPDVSFTALTPLAFLGRSVDVFADKTAIVYGERRLTYREFAVEANRLAPPLQASGVRPGDRVAYLCPNIPEMLVANFRRAARRRDPRPAQHPAVRRRDRLHLHPRRRGAARRR